MSPDDGEAESHLYRERSSVERKPRRVALEERAYELCAVDRSGAARPRLSVRRGRQAGVAVGGADGADAAAAAGLVRPLHRRGGGARRARPDPPRAPAYSAG